MKHQKLLSVSTVTLVLARKFMVLHRSLASLAGSTGCHVSVSSQPFLPGHGLVLLAFVSGIFGAFSTSFFNNAFLLPSSTSPNYFVLYIAHARIMAWGPDQCQLNYNWMWACSCSLNNLANVPIHTTPWQHTKWLLSLLVVIPRRLHLTMASHACLFYNTHKHYLPNRPLDMSGPNCMRWNLTQCYDCG